MSEDANSDGDNSFLSFFSDNLTPIVSGGIFILGYIVIYWWVKAQGSILNQEQEAAALNKNDSNPNTNDNYGSSSNNKSNYSDGSKAAAITSENVATQQ